MARLFISHSSLDNVDAEELKAWLTARGFENAFLDIDKQSGIQPGADWEKTLYREIERAQAVVILVTDHWLQSKWCFAEFTQARALGKAIFPLIIAPTGEKIVGEDIQTIDLTSDREGGLDRLSRRLTEIALQSPEGFDLPKDTVPFPGLSAFEERHAAVFYGRDPEIRDLLERLRRARTTSDKKLIAILGASGSGKSSLLRAGLVPRLKRDRDNWIVCPPFRPEGDPLHRLIDTLLLSVRQHSGKDAKISPEQEETWRGELASEAPGKALKEIARTLRRQSGAMDAQILIPIDQAEELFTIAEPADRKAFFFLLDRLLAEHLPFVAVAALRSDHLGELQKADELSAPYELFPLAPMPLERVGSLVRGPARLVGLKADDDMISALIRDAESEDALPLIAFLLRKMFETFGADKVWTLEHYRSFGNKETGDTPLHDAVRRAAEEALPKLLDKDAAHLREAFVPALVRVNAEGSFVRKAARLDGFDGNARPLLEKLVDARLLVTRGLEITNTDDGEAEPSTETSETTLEVAHEALFRVWPRLASWLEQEREFLIGKARLDQAYSDWQALDEKSKRKGLLSGVMLERARIWLIDHPGRFTAGEKDFIRLSAEMEAEDRRRRERMRRNLFGALTAAVVILMVGAGASTYFYFQQKEQAKIAAANAERAEREAHKARKQETIAKQNQIAAQKAERTAKFDAARYASAIAQGLWQNGKYNAAMIVARAPLPGEEAQKELQLYQRNFEEISRSVHKHDSEISAFLGHRDDVNSVNVSPDGKLAVTSSDDGYARLWDVATGRVVQVLIGHKSTVNHAEFSTDGQLVVTASDDDMVIIWEVATGKIVRKLAGHSGAVKKAHFSSDRKVVVSYDYEKVVYFWDIINRRDFKIKYRAIINSIDISTKTREVLITLSDGTAEVRQAATGNLTFVLTGHTEGIESAEFSKDGNKIVTASGDGTARLWDAGSGRTIHTLASHSDKVVDASFSMDGKFVATVSHDGTAMIWNVNSGQRIYKISSKRGGIRSVSFFSDNDTLFVALPENEVGLWSLTSGEKLGVIDHILVSKKELISISPDGSKFITDGFGDNRLRVWSKYTLDHSDRIFKHEKHIRSIQMSPDGLSLLTSSSDKTAKIWKFGSSEPDVIFKGHKNTVEAAIYSPRGDYVVTDSYDHTMRLWDATSGKQLLVLSEDRPSSLVGFSGDGRYLVSETLSGTLLIWDFEDGGHFLIQANTEVPPKAIISPDGRYVLARKGKKDVGIWSLDDGKLYKTLRHRGDTFEFVFTPNGKRIITYSNDGYLNIWNFTTGESLLKTKSAKINHMSVSNDSRYLIAVSEEYILKYLIKDDKLFLLNNVHAGNRVYFAKFDPENSRIVTSGSGSRGALWDFGTGRKIMDFEHLGSDSNKIAFSPDGKFLYTQRLNKVLQISLSLVTVSRNDMGQLEKDENGEIVWEQQKPFSSGLIDRSFEIAPFDLSAEEKSLILKE